MDQAALQRVTLVRTSGTLCWTAWGAREQQSLRTWILFLFLVFFLNFLADPLVCYATMHCRYFAETKILREHLNSSAAIFQLGVSVTMHG